MTIPDRQPLRWNSPKVIFGPPDRPVKECWPDLFTIYPETCFIPQVTTTAEHHGLCATSFAIYPVGHVIITVSGRRANGIDHGSLSTCPDYRSLAILTEECWPAEEWPGRPVTGGPLAAWGKQFAAVTEAIAWTILREECGIEFGRAGLDIAPLAATMITISTGHKWPHCLNKAKLWLGDFRLYEGYRF